MSLAILTIEGVLSQGDLKTTPPTKWGKALYGGARSQFNVMLLTSAERELAKGWLAREHFHDYSTLLSWDQSFFDFPQWRVQQVKGMLAEGWEVACVIDNDPEVCFEVQGLGVLTLKVSYPGKPGWSVTSGGTRPWDGIVDTVERRNLTIQEG